MQLVTKKSKKVRNILENFPDKFCKHCNKLLSKRNGVNRVAYNRAKFCSPLCAHLDKLSERICPNCQQSFVVPKSSKWDYCISCRKKSPTHNRKKCSNENCDNLILWPTIIRFGKQRFCCLNCFVIHMKENIRLCEKCTHPIISISGCNEQYSKAKRHNDCHSFLKAISKLEKKASKKYLSYTPYTPFKEAIS